LPLSTRFKIVVALWFVVQIALPFTAPLQAIDLTDLFGRHSHHQTTQQQCRHDTIVAVQRPFDQLMEIDVIEIRVFEPRPSARILLAGTVSRHDVTAVTTPSSRMQLKLLGIHGDTISWPAT
jgi:hypothetical protein